MVYETVPFYRSTLNEVLLSVHLSVTSRSSTKTPKHRITKLTSYDSAKTQVFCCQRISANSNICWSPQFRILYFFSFFTVLCCLFRFTVLLRSDSGILHIKLNWIEHAQQDIGRKSPILTHPLVFGAPLKVTHRSFADIYVSRKLRVHEISYGAVCVILFLAGLIQYRLVTYGLMETGPEHMPRWHSAAS